MEPRSESVHVTMARDDYLTLAYEAARRRVGRGRLLLQLAGPGLAEIRRQDAARHGLGGGAA